MPHPIESIIKTTMENLKNIIRVDTVVGDPIRLENNTLVLPVSRVSLGFVTGGGEYEVGKSAVLRSGHALDDEFNRLPFAGTTAAGVSIVPVSFLAVKNEQVTMLPAQYSGCALEKIVDSIPQILTACREIVKELHDKSGGEQQR